MSNDEDRPFRFYDNRQKYLSFVTTCNEKWKVAERAIRELDYIEPTPAALRIFDAGMGDGTLLSHVMRATHKRFPTVPLYVVGKEISLEDIRMSLEKLPDRFVEHPASVVIFSTPSKNAREGSSGVDGVLAVHSVPLAGSTMSTSVNVPPTSKASAKLIVV